MLDQWTKNIVRTNLMLGEIWSPWEWLTPYVRILHWSNTGAAFGIFQEGGQVFIVVAIIVSLAIIYYFPQIPSEQWGVRLAVSMQMGGALGNLVDRLTIGPVTDFVSVGNFAIFNVADASVSVGVAILILAMWVEERKLRAQDAVINPIDPAGCNDLPGEPQPEQDFI